MSGNNMGTECSLRRRTDHWRITGQSDEHTYFDICYEFVRYERKGKADEMPE